MNQYMINKTYVKEDGNLYFDVFVNLQAKGVDYKIIDAQEHNGLLFVKFLIDVSELKDNILFFNDLIIKKHSYLLNTKITHNTPPFNEDETKLEFDILPITISILCDFMKKQIFNIEDIINEIHHSPSY